MSNDGVFLSDSFSINYYGEWITILSDNGQDQQKDNPVYHNCLRKLCLK